MEHVIRVENLNVAFAGKEVVQGVSFDLQKGELLALVGESGSGKSVLCRALLGLPPPCAQIRWGTLQRPKESQMSLVMQNAMTALDPAMPVGKQIMEAHKSRRLSPAELLHRVGIDHAQVCAAQYPGEFSGGMRQRAAIAIALAMEPAVIFADEPTTALDADIRMQMMMLLDEIRKNSGTSILFVTHDLSLVRDFADRVLIMKDGKIIERGSTAAIFEHPQADYTKELIRYAAIGNPRNHTHGKIHYHGTGLHAHGHIGPHLHQKKNTVSVEDENTSPPLVEVKNLSKSYPLTRKNRNYVLENISFAIYPGEIVGLCGRSGIGKSTLARCIAGLEKPSSGQRIAKKDIKVQMIFQDSVSALNPRMTVEQIIAEPLYLRDKTPPPRQQILDLMAQAELEPELIARRPHEISGGQRQRVSIARAIALPPDLIIADEPVSSLDVTTCSKIIHLLKHLKDEHNLTMLLIAHDLHLLAHISDRIIAL